MEVLVGVIMDSSRALSPKPKRFYNFPHQDFGHASRSEPNPTAEITRHINDSQIGSRQTFLGPFGRRRITYCDCIASGRSLSFIEDFIRDQVLPFYANTHTMTTVTSLQTSLFRNEARDIMRNACHASEDDAVIFAGSGCTGAVHKLIEALGLAKHGSNLTVFVSGMEHHSNMLPWRDLGARMINVPFDRHGRIDELALEELLEANSRTQSQMVGCFCAASNITGLLNDDLAITALLHRYNALAFWDYATAAPYVHIDMNPKVPEDGDNLCYKDAIYFSMHKFVGGGQTPGVLIAKKRLFMNDTPNGGGGGSVFFVKEDDHRYLQDPEVREEGGTPAIVGSIRAGMVMQLKQAVGAEVIMRRDEELFRRARQVFQDNPNLILLGDANLHRLPVLSFMVKHGQGYLHHNYVAAILNDVFGIQSRGGCVCAGPHAQYLLGMDQILTSQYEDILIEDQRLDRTHLRRGQAEYSSFEIFRPGFTRLNLPWYSSDEQIQFILKAIDWVGECAWKLLPQYRMNNETGDWKHFTNLEFKERKWLGNISYSSGQFQFLSKGAKEDNPTPEAQDFPEVLEQAFKVIAIQAQAVANKQNVPDQRLIFGQAQHLRWFVVPSEAKAEMCAKSTTLAGPQAPFKVREFPAPNPVGPSVGLPKYGTYWTGYTLSDRLRNIFAQPRIPSSGWLPYKQDEPQETRQNGGPSVMPVTQVVEKVRHSQSQSTAEDTCHDGVCVLTEERGPIPESEHKTSWRAPSKDIFKPFLEAVADFEMIKDGDRVLVCLSGGKDSLSLLHTMKQYQYYGKKSGIHFELGAVTVDPLSSAYDPRPLIPYLKTLGVPYLYEEQEIMKQALKADCSSICAFCSRMKRGRIYAAARRNNYNVLAMGQHLDDLAESFLMSVFHNGRLRTMKAHYTVREGDLRVIRPLAYVREKQLRDFAERQKLPVIPENCPACFESPKERHRTKQLLAQQELLFPKLYWSLKSAMRPVMNIRATGVESIIFGGQSHGTQEPSSDEES
eukprot:snap_masked-scaffold548_size139981-processed-gene-0.14 protein:Tk08560 transcript:snap_masked-scaffold548_size139981-processed-gene-0.14-mRNA-1 annotation:"PREDICTED: uncharacterized protein LOC100175538"